MDFCESFACLRRGEEANYGVQTGRELEGREVESRASGRVVASRVLSRES